MLDLKDWDHYSQLFRCFKYVKVGINLHSANFYAWITSFWIQILKLKTLDNYSKAKIMTTYKITRITFFITETTKTNTTKIYIYIYTTIYFTILIYIYRNRAHTFSLFNCSKLFQCLFYSCYDAKEVYYKALRNEVLFIIGYRK